MFRLYVPQDDHPRDSVAGNRASSGGSPHY
jgi:hypothetical protein